MEKVAVTGAGGKVGHQVIKELKENGYNVLAITKTPAGFWEEEVSLDIRNYNQLENALKDCDGLIHLAAIPTPVNNDDSLVLETNVVGSHNVMRAAGENNISRLALASSDCTLGFTFSKNKPDPLYLPVDENHPLKPDDSYGLSKVLMERTAEAMVQRYPHMSIASLRITHVANKEEYKPGANFHSWIKNPDLGPKNLWSYIDNRDVARAFRTAIETDLGGHEVFFVTAENTRCELPTGDLIEKYCPDVKLKTEITGHMSLEDTTKAEKILGFKPRYSWQEELKEE